MKKFIFGALATIGGFMVISFIILILFVSSTRLNLAEIDENSVLYIDFNGKVTENRVEAGLAGLFQDPSDSLYHILKAIDTAARDPKIVGIIANIGQAEVGIAQVQEIRNALMRFRVLGLDSGKFTIAYTDTFGEAGPGTTGYYLASAFDEIWLQPLGMLGFTGLAAEMPFAKDTLDVLGVKARIGQREEYKSALESFTNSQMTAANRESLESLLNSLMNQLVRDIALSREITESEVMEAANKGPLLGNEALKLGMIDRLAYADEVETHANSRVKGVIKKISVGRYLETIDMDTPASGQPKVALIYGTGTIKRQAGQQSLLMQERDMDAGRISKAFNEAVKDRDVSAIVFRVNSPGGSPVASETILRAVRKAQQAGKPVVVSMSDYAASGGYWISSYADKIVAQPGTITGSIGVVSGKIIFEDFWKNIGVNWDSVKVGDNALMWSSNSDYSEYGWERLQAYLDQIYSGFIERVSEGRKLPIEHVEQVAKGRVWSGEEALKYSLVDKLGDLKDAVEVAKELAGLKDQVIPVQIYPGPRSFTESIRDLLYGGEDDVAAPSTLSSFIGTIIEALISLMVMVDDVTSNSNGSAQTILPFKKIKG